MYSFAVLPYVNAAPLVHFLPEVCPEAELTYHTPKEMFPELAGGQVDAAIVPVVDYLDMPELVRVGGIGICADGEVKSVLLQCQCPLEEVKTVNLDPASRTSNRLVKLLLKEHFRVRQEIQFRVGATESDAWVVIGDRALLARSAWKSYDVAEEWKKMTGLPFVFAVWAYRMDHPDKPKLSEILRTAKEIGCKAIAKLARIHAKRLGLTESRCLHYLTCCIRYDLGPAEQKGMKLFRELYTGLAQIHRQTIKEDSKEKRRIVSNERKSQTVEPVGPRLR